MFVQHETGSTDGCVIYSTGMNIIEEWSLLYGTLVDDFPLSVLILGDLGLHAEHL